MKMSRKLKSFYGKYRTWVLVAVGIVAILVVITLSGYSFSVFGGWSRKPF